MSELPNSNNNKRLHLRKDQRLPRCYKDTEKIIRSVKSCEMNFKTALAQSRMCGGHYKKVYNLTLNVLKHYEYIQKIIDEMQLLEKEKLLRREIASILIYEILFGIGNLPGESKAVSTIQKYKNNIMNAHQKLQNSNYDILVKGLTIPRYARIHTLVTTVAYVVKDLENFGFKQIIYNEDITEKEYFDSLKNIEKGSFLIDFHFKDILVFAHNENLYNLKLYKDGHIFLQDKSSYIPVHVLNPEPGSTVLDACAAPGMKAIHIASKMENKGLLIACERNQERFNTLKEMLQYGAVKISKMHCTDFKLIDPNNPTYSSVKYILLDPSCSGSGMVNRMDEVTDTEDSKTKNRLEKLAGFQIILLKHALKFPSVKRVVYSTCSVHEEENEFVIHEALNAFGRSFKLVPAMPDWPERGTDNFEYGKLCLRTVPEKHLTNGFFVAAFERVDYDEDIEYNEKHFKKFKNSQKNYIFDDTNNERNVEEKDTHNFSGGKQKIENARNIKSKKNKKYDSHHSELHEKVEKNNYVNDTQTDLQSVGTYEKISKDFPEKQQVNNFVTIGENVSTSATYKKHKKKKKDKKTSCEYDASEEYNFVSPISEIAQHCKSESNMQAESESCGANMDVSANSVKKHKKHKHKKACVNISDMAPVNCENIVQQSKENDDKNVSNNLNSDNFVEKNEGIDTSITVQHKKKKKHKKTRCEYNSNKQDDFVNPTFEVTQQYKTETSIQNTESCKADMDVFTNSAKKHKKHRKHKRTHSENESLSCITSDNHANVFKPNQESDSDKVPNLNSLNENCTSHLANAQTDSQNVTSNKNLNDFEEKQQLQNFLEKNVFITKHNKRKRDKKAVYEPGIVEDHAPKIAEQCKTDSSIQNEFESHEVNTDISTSVLKKHKKHKRKHSESENMCYMTLDSSNNIVQQNQENGNKNVSNSPHSCVPQKQKKKCKRPSIECISDISTENKNNSEKISVSSNSKTGKDFSVLVGEKCDILQHQASSEDASVVEKHFSKKHKRNKSNKNKADCTTNVNIAVDEAVFDDQNISNTCEVYTKARSEILECEDNVESLNLRYKKNKLDSVEKCSSKKHKKNKAKSNDHSSTYEEIKNNEIMIDANVNKIKKNKSCELIESCSKKSCPDDTLEYSTPLRFDKFLNISDQQIENIIFGDSHMHKMHKKRKLLEDVKVGHV